MGSPTDHFRALRDLRAKATSLRSGDVLAGVAAANAPKRVAAQRVLADLPWGTFLKLPLRTCESDEVTRLTIDRHGTAAFAPPPPSSPRASGGVPKPCP